MRSGDVIAERFLVESLAGEGGMGTVYRARDRATESTVAVKVMTGAVAADAERFAREAEVLRALEHPGVVGYVAHGATDAGAPWLAMEWLDGEDLATRLARESLGAAESIEIAHQVAKALGAAHARGIVHRDVKPGNLFLVNGDALHVKVLDFGIARPGGMLASISHTRTGAVIGTPGYMAPEQARGQRGIDARADVFSLGCVLFECLTGRAAFVAEHVVAVLAKVLFEDTPRLREMFDGPVDAIDSLLARVLAKQRDERPADGNVLAAEIDALGAVTITRRTAEQHAPTSLTAGEQRWVAVVIAAPSRDDVLTAGTARTLRVDDVSALDVQLASVAVAHRARLERLADGSRVLVLTATGAATDHASRAARCALAVQSLLGGAPTALAMGRARVDEDLPVGDALDRAADRVRRMRSRTAAGVMIDETTAGLLDARFDVRGDELGLLLRGEREVLDAARTLLGKATPCVGREREIGTLLAIWNECVAEPVARAALVTGSAGVGKSRVRHEFVKKISEQDPPPQVWVGRADSVGAGSAFALLAPSIRRAAGVFEGEPLAVRQRKLRGRVARSVAERDRGRVTEFLGELIATPFPDENSPQLRAARADRILMGDQMRAAWEDFLQAECEAGPVLIVLEDVHWGDLPSVALIDRALRNLRERPWMVLALARPEVHERFPKLWAERGVQESRLMDLTARSVEKLVRAVLGTDIAPERVARLLERSTGNPFYLEELIRAEFDGKGDAVPDTVLAMVDSRLGALDAATRRVLRAASVFGEVFWRGAVAALVGFEAQAPELRAILDDLEQREVIARVGSGKFAEEIEYAFRHSVVREAAYGMLLDADRALGHRLAAEWLEHAGEPDSVQVAEHFEKGGQQERALEGYTRAAEQALAGNDFGAVIARAQAGLACGATGERQGWLKRLEAEAYRWQGDYARATECGAAATELLALGTDAWCEAADQAAAVAGYVGDLERVQSVARALEEVLTRGDATERCVFASARAALSLMYCGRRGEADLVAQRCEDALRALPIPSASLEGRMSQMRAQRKLGEGDTGAFLALSLVTKAAYERAGDARNGCTALGSVGYGLLETGAWAESETALRSVLVMAERLGVRNVAAAAKHNLGLVLARRGALPEALAIETEAVEIFHAQGDRRLEAGGRVYLAEIQIASGNYAAAERHARIAVDIVPATHPMRAYGLAMLARVLHLASPEGPPPAEALARVEEALGVVTSTGNAEYGETLLRRTHAEILHRSGDLEGALRAIVVARDRVMERALRISDPKRRASFLENVPDHAETLALARAWGVS